MKRVYVMATKPDLFSSLKRVREVAKWYEDHGYKVNTIYDYMNLNDVGSKNFAFDDHVKAADIVYLVNEKDKPIPSPKEMDHLIKVAKEYGTELQYEYEPVGGTLISVIGDMKDKDAIEGATTMFRLYGYIVIPSPLLEFNESDVKTNFVYYDWLKEYDTPKEDQLKKVQNKILEMSSTVWLVGKGEDKWTRDCIEYCNIRSIHLKSFDAAFDAGQIFDHGLGFEVRV